MCKGFFASNCVDVIVADGNIDAEKWFKTTEGFRITGSDYIRHVYVKVFQCTKCGRKRALKRYDTESDWAADKLDPDYALELLRGNSAAQLGIVRQVVRDAIKGLGEVREGMVVDEISQPFLDDLDEVVSNLKKEA